MLFINTLIASAYFELTLIIVYFCGRLFRQSSQTALETTIVAGLMGDSQRDGGCVCLNLNFLQLRGVAGIGDVSEKRKCHIFAIFGKDMALMGGKKRQGNN